MYLIWKRSFLVYHEDFSQLYIWEKANMSWLDNPSVNYTYRQTLLHNTLVAKNLNAFLSMLVIPKWVLKSYVWSIIFMVRRYHKNLCLDVYVDHKSTDNVERFVEIWTQRVSRISQSIYIIQLKSSKFGDVSQLTYIYDVEGWARSGFIPRSFAKSLQKSMWNPCVFSLKF